MSIANFLKESGDVYIFTGEELHVYIPEDYFDKKLAEDFATSIYVFGLLNCQMFKGGKPLGKLEIMNVPTMINIFPEELEPQTLELTKGDLQKYRVAKFYKDSKLMVNAVTRDTDFVDTYIRILTGGKLVKTIPYDKVLSTWQRNLDIQSVNLGVPSTVLETIVREIYRNPEKPQESFALKLNKGTNVSMTSYQGASIREVCALNSTFAGLTFEYMDLMLNYGINNSAYKKSQTDSPIEKIIKM